MGLHFDKLPAFYSSDIVICKRSTPIDDMPTFKSVVSDYTYCGLEIANRDAMKEGMTTIEGMNGSITTFAE
jgi:hypothetical protein